MVDNDEKGFIDLIIDYMELINPLQPTIQETTNDMQTTYAEISMEDISDPDEN